MRRRKRLNRKILAILGIVMTLGFFVVFAIIRSSKAKYVSVATSATQLDVAVYALSEDNDLTILLDTLVPRTAPYEYQFAITNVDGDTLTDTAIVYDLKLIATTNIPLTYKLCVSSTNFVSNCQSNSVANAINHNVVARDADGTFFRTMTTTQKEFGYTQVQTNYYTLLVYFPETYNSSEYQDLVESIQINVDSRQKLEND